jgi:hypothetical protein
MEDDKKSEKEQGKKPTASERTKALAKQLDEINFKNRQAMKVMAENSRLISDSIGKRKQRRQSEGSGISGLATFHSPVRIPEGYSRGGRQ